MVIRLRPAKLRIRDAGITLLNAMQDPALFGPWFKEQGTWRSWRVFLRALFGLPILSAGDRAIYQKHTSRSKTPATQAREGWLVVGRRGGKSVVCALVAVFLACFRDYRPFLARGERATVVVISTDRRQSRVIFRYITALLEGVPLLSKMVDRMGADSIDLKAPVTLEVHTASFRSVRGLTVAAAILDEVAFFRSEESANPDTEIVNALLPAMSTIPNALLLGISSPYAKRGILWERYGQHYAQDGDPILVWQADTLSMNPTIPSKIIDEAYRDDPVAAAAEYGAAFRSDISGFLDAELIGSLVVPGVHELPPNPAFSYLAAVDPSGGRSDSFALSIAHAEGKRLVLDVCRARPAPLDPRTVVAEYANVLKQYGCYRVLGDRYSAEWVVSAFREHGIQYDTSERVASEIFLQCLPHFTTGAIQLLDHRVLLNELRQLERRTGRDKDLICHPAHGHDDAAVSACSALLQCARGTMSAEEFQRAAMAVGMSDARAARDEHLASDLGFVDVGDASFDSDDSPFNERHWK